MDEDSIGNDGVGELLMGNRASGPLNEWDAEQMMAGSIMEGGVYEKDVRSRNRAVKVGSTQYVNKIPYKVVHYSSKCLVLEPIEKGEMKDWNLLG